jgi:hypothetical protein
MLFSHWDDENDAAERVFKGANRDRYVVFDCRIARWNEDDAGVQNGEKGKVKARRVLSAMC